MGGRSKLADQYLTGLKGIEVGGQSHNAFGLDTINVDYTDEHPKIANPMKVDFIEEGDNMHFADKSYDFVISSHVIEHFWNPLKALREWERIAKRYIYIICPHKDRTFDIDNPVTPLQELIDRDTGKMPCPDPYPRGHNSIWRTKDFIEVVRHLRLPILEAQDVDDKVGNGFAILIGDLNEVKYSNRA